MSTSPSNMENEDPDTPDMVLSSKDDNHSPNNASAEAAGFVRGLTRSLGRSVARLPIGSLPHRAVFRRRLPVRQATRVSDRLSTGIDWFASAMESTPGGGEAVKKQPRIAVRVTTFVTSLLKNTLLGAAVFEAYGYTIFKLAPPTTGESFKRHIQVEDDEGKTQLQIDEDDEFARASLTAHFGGGLVAGTVHGVASTVMEINGANAMLRSLPVMTVHHALAHSLLFGSYEAIKRALLNNILDEDGQQGQYHYGGEYLLCFGVAGGLAGQIQHVASHYSEQLLGLSQVLSGEPQKVASASVSSHRFVTTAPAIRPTTMAFLPSAIGFVAFEYGKKFVT